MKKRRSDYKGISKVCQNCKKVYEDVKERRLKFCSLKCWKQNVSKKQTYVCKNCGTIYITTPTRNTKYCSGVCMFKDFTGRKRTEEWCANISLGKLKGNLPSKGKQLRRLTMWKQCRKKTLNRDGFMCQICFNGGIEVHHIKPTREFPELAFDLDNLVTLCKKCHMKTYMHEKDWEDYFKR